MLVTACRLAISPTRTSPFLANATTDGVVRPPSALAMIVGSPPSRTATAELVVPRSMPTARAISYLLYDEWSGEQSCYCPPLCFFMTQCARDRPELSSRRSANLRPPHSTYVTSRLFPCVASRFRRVRAPCTHPCCTGSEVGPVVRSRCPLTCSTSGATRAPSTTCVVSTTPRSSSCC